MDRARYLAGKFAETDLFLEVRALVVGICIFALLGAVFTSPIWIGILLAYIGMTWDNCKGDFGCDVLTNTFILVIVYIVVFSAKVFVHAVIKAIHSMIKANSDYNAIDSK